MSIPPRKPLNPIDLFTHVSHKAHEGAVTERHPSEDDNAPPRAPVRAPGGLRRIPSGMLSGPMSPIFGLMTRFIRTLGDTRSEPLNIATKT
jgi:hypothetical protein